MSQITYTPKAQREAHAARIAAALRQFDPPAKPRGFLASLWAWLTKP